MEISGWIVILAGVFALSEGLPARIHVGGLFDAEEEEMELAFRIAVDWLNTDENLLPNSRVVAMVEKLYSENSFKATQLCCSLLQKNITAIFGPQSDLSSMHVQSICDDLEVPHIESRWEYRLTRDLLSINLYPHPTVLNNALVRILKIWGWTEFYLVYEEDEAIVRMKDILIEGEKHKWDIKLYHFKKNHSYRDVFWEIKKTKKAGANVEFHIVLDVPRKNLYEALKSAQQVGMMTEHQKYLITSLDLHTIDLEDFQYGKTNITGLRLVQEDTAEFQGLLQEINNRMARRRDTPPLTTLKTETTLIYDSVRLLALGLEQMDAAKHVSMIPAISCNQMNKGIDGTSLINFMKNAPQMKTPGLSGLIEFNSEGFRSIVSLDVMYLTPNGLTKIGTALPGGSINVTTPGSSEFRRIGLQGSHFRVTTIKNPPYTILAESPKLLSGNERFEGYSVDLLHSLAELLDFTFEIHLVKDEKYGKMDKNAPGGFNGMIGEVIRGEADLAIADLTITNERLQGVDFTLPFMQTGISILFKKPTEKVTSLFSFLLPFSGEVWMLVMGAYTFVTLCLFVVGRMSPYEWNNPHPCRQNDQVEENCFSLLNSMWFTIGSLMQQGSDVAPTAMSTRAITSIWYFFCLIMISSYTANLAAFLTVEKLVSPIENHEDLAKQEKIKYGCVDGGSTFTFFRDSNFTVFQTMHKFMQKHKSEVYVGTNPEGIQKVRQGNYAFMMEATTIEYNTERECDLTQIGGLLDSKGYGIALKKNNLDLRNWLSGGILKLQEDGKLYTLKERWWKEKRGGGKCTASGSSSSVNELGLGNVGGVFVVMLLGIVLSAFVAVLEFLWFQRKLVRDPEDSLLKLLLKEIKYAVSCGSSSKPAPKLKVSDKEEEEKAVSAYY